MQALEEAEKINEATFLASYYLPDVDGYSLPESTQDLFEIARATYSILYEFKGYEKKHFPANKAIAKDPAKRAKKALQLLNVLLHRYPFPNSIELTGNAWTKTEPRSIEFKSIEGMRRWIGDLETVYGELRLLQLFIKAWGPPSCVQALADKNKGLIENRDLFPFGSIFGSADPTLLLDDFAVNVNKVSDILSSTKSKLNRVNIFKSGTLPKWLTILGLILWTAAFISGVVMPLFFRSVRKWVLLYFPVGVYGIMIVLVFLKMSNLLRM